jgi:DNA-binding NarL/FixJ family response regulator
LLGGSSYADAHQALGLAHAASGEPAAARRAFVQARALYRAVQHHFQVATAATTELHAVLAPYLADQPAERERVAAEAEHEWAQASGVWAGVLPALARLPLLVIGGQWREARRLALEACAAGGIVSRRYFASALLGEVARAQGDADLAWEQVGWALPDGPRTAPGDMWLLPALALQRLAAGLALDAGDLAAARAWLEAHDRWLGWSGAVLGRADGRLGWARCHRAAGDPAGARAAATRALADAGAPRQPMALLAAHRLLGEIEAVAGHKRVAEDHLQAALALADACAAPYERALTLLALAELRLTDRDQSSALALLDEVRAICEPLDAIPALARAAALAAAPATAAPTGRPAGLSGREVEVLRLVAAGLTNAEVAAELALSPRTVEQHLRSIYNKLGVSSRTAATRFAVEQGLG